VRGTTDKYNDDIFFKDYDLVGGVNARDINTIYDTIYKYQPCCVINCIGIVKQLPESNDLELSYKVNTVLPRKLAVFCRGHGAKLIHISTDCVFDGKIGNYDEDSPITAEDIYGLTKFTGEVEDEYNLTLRTSIIGRELKSSNGLLEWLLSKKGQIISGYTKAIFTGLTTMELSHQVVDIIKYYDDISGLYHISSDPINKYILLQKLNEAYNNGATINPDDSVAIDRSLKYEEIEYVCGYIPKVWDDMIDDLVDDATPYEEIRKLNLEKKNV
jgi:dTDP-4-dehydrorhamnose reductase